MKQQQHQREQSMNNHFLRYLQHMGTREGVASKIDVETQGRLQEMIRSLVSSKEPVVSELLTLVYDIKPELHKNYRHDL